MPVMAPGHHRDGARLQRCPVRAHVDAPGEARGDHITHFAELAGQALREGQSGRRGIARADDGDARPGETSVDAAHGDQRRRRIDGRRVFGYSGSPMATKRTPRRAAAAISFSASARLATFRRRRPPSGRDPAMRRGRPCAAELVDEGPEGAGPTFSERIRRSQSRRCSSVRRVTLMPFARSCPRCRPEGA